MKESRIILVTPDEYEFMNKAIKDLEDNGWEVVEHRLSATSTSLCSRVYVSILFQREKV